MGSCNFIVFGRLTSMLSHELTPCSYLRSIRDDEWMRKLVNGRKWGKLLSYCHGVVLMADFTPCFHESLVSCPKLPTRHWSCISLPQLWELVVSACSRSVYPVLSAQLLSYTAEPLKGVMPLYAEPTQEMVFSGPTWIIESHVGCQV